MRRVKQSSYLFRSPWLLHIQDNLSVKIPVFFEEKQSSIIHAHFSLTRWTGHENINCCEVHKIEMKNKSTE